MMKPLLLVCVVAVLPACATWPATTAMEECASGVCDPPPPTPDQQVKQRAVAELECPAERVRVQLVGGDRFHQTWDARGCGRTTIYDYCDYYDTSDGSPVSRKTPIVASPLP